ncbi:TetR family transcriptional regulator [Microbacterium sp. CH-015]|uniref:TetR family transcriptional regulator n=1 Tax=Microbacterium sp. CH-015 TaxID=3406734 RepID=UPI003C734CBB
MPREPKQERAVATRKALVDSAGRVFADKHYSAATLADVLTAAGVSQGSLYFHFRNKHDLALAVIAAQGNAMQSVREDVLLRASGPIDALERTAEAVAALISKSPVVQGGLRLLIQSRDEFPEVTVDPYELWLSFAAARFADAKAQGMLRPGVDPADAGWLFVSAFMGAKEILSYHRNWADLPRRAGANAALVLSAVLGSLAYDQEPSIQA